MGTRGVVTSVGHAIGAVLLACAVGPALGVTGAGASGIDAQATLIGAAVSEAGGVAVSSGGTVYVVTSYQHSLVLGFPNGSGPAVTEPFGDLGEAGGVATEGQDVYVASSDGVKEISPATPAPVTLPFGALEQPQGIAVDPFGDVFVVNTGANEVEELAAGSTTPHVLPFSGLESPTGIAVDSSGDLYVANTGAGDIIELPSNSGASTVVMSGLQSPNYLAVGSSGDIYLTCTITCTGEVGSGKVVEITPQLQIQTLPFSGFNVPSGIAVDQRGDVFAGDVAGVSNVVEELPLGGTSAMPISNAGGLLDGTGIASDTAGDLVVSDAHNGLESLRANAATPVGVEVPSLSGGTLGVAENQSGTLAVVTSGGVDVYAVGASAPIQLTFASLSGTLSVALDSAGDLFVTGSGSSVVDEVPAGTTAASPLPFQPLSSPNGLAVDSSGDVYVSDSQAEAVYELPYGSSSAIELGFSGLDIPKGLAVDSVGDVFVANSGAGNILELPADSTEQTLPFKDLVDPVAVAVDGAGDVFVLDGWNEEVEELEQVGAPSTIAILDQPPANVEAGRPFRIGLAVEDDAGHVVTGAAEEVSVAALVGSSVMPGALQCEGGTTVLPEAGLLTLTCEMEEAVPAAQITASATGLLPVTTDGFSVSRQRTVTTVRATPSTTTYGNAVLFSVTVNNGDPASAAPATGAVAIELGHEELCSAILTNGSGSCTTATAPGGVDTVTAKYSGNGANARSSATTSLRVAARSTGTELKAPATSVRSGRTLSLTATVSPVPKAGTVSFFSGSTVIGSCASVRISANGGVAACTTSFAVKTTTTKDLHAVFSGSPDYSSSASRTLRVIVRP